MIVKFREPAQFLQALMLRPPLPKEVLRFPDGWGMQVDDRDSEAAITILQRQFGWEMTWVESGGTPVPIFEILSGIWDYRDPLNGPPVAAPILAGAHPGGVYYDISDEDNDYEYLLGARDEAESQKILNSLQRNLVRGVSGTPLLLAPTEPPCPFVFFFLVRWKHPEPFVFERAGRAWWGPIVRNRVRVYLEWPYSVSIPAAALDEIPWPQDATHVLLSRDSPSCLILKRRKAGEAFHGGIAEIARLTAEGADVRRVEATQPPDRPNLRVRIQLTERAPQYRLNDRINELGVEIEAKTQIRAQLEKRLELQEESLAATEPLLLFPEQLPGKIPYELRRLLVEWADLDEDLQSIYYASLNSAQLPGFQPGSRVHAVTTGRALDRDSNQVGVRLREYASESRPFELRPEWASFGLKLFCPAENHPELYPDMRPGRIGAMRLAEALLPSGSPDPMKDWIVVLMQPPDGPLHAMQLRNADFQPVCDAWQWNCRVNLEVDAVRAGQTWARETIPAAVDSFRNSLQGAVRSEATRLLDPLLNQVRSEIQRLSGEVARIQGELADEQAFLKRLSAETPVLRRAAQGCRDAANRAVGLARSLQAGGQTLQDSLEKLVGLAREVGGSQAALSGVERNLREIAKARPTFWRKLADILLARTKRRGAGK
jgi:hypothetical protein